MKQVDLWLPEDVTIDDGEGNIYSGITHIESGADGYAETFDGEVLLFSDMNEQMLSQIEQIVEDYADCPADAPMEPADAKAIGWVRDGKGNVTNYTVKDVCNCITQFSGGSGFKDPDTGMANTSPYILLEY